MRLNKIPILLKMSCDSHSYDNKYEKKEIRVELKKVIEDMDGPQKIIINPQDELLFDSEIEGKKKLNKKKIYEALSIVYSYSKALAYRLSFDGDLTGSLEFKDENGKEENGSSGFKISEKKEPSKKEETSPQKSVIDELDDLF